METTNNNQINAEEIEELKNYMKQVMELCITALEEGEKTDKEYAELKKIAEDNEMEYSEEFKSITEEYNKHVERQKLIKNKIIELTK